MKAALRETERRELLAETLNYVLPKDKAKKTCQALLNAFGSFDGIFAAPEEILKSLPDVGPETARFLRLVIRLSQEYLEERTWDLQRVYDTPSAAGAFRPKFLGRKTEAACLMLLDGRGRIVFNDMICEGSVDQVPLHLRMVLRLCIEYGAADVMLAHNHPSGVAFPSFGDLSVTYRLIAALESIGARLRDHIIFADDSYYSFCASGALDQQVKIVLTAQANGMESIRELELKLKGKAK